MSAYLSALREEGTRDDLLAAIEREMDRVDRLHTEVDRLTKERDEALRLLDGYGEFRGALLEKEELARQADFLRTQLTAARAEEERAYQKGYQHGLKDWRKGQAAEAQRVLGDPAKAVTSAALSTGKSHWEGRTRNPNDFYPGPEYAVVVGDDPNWFQRMMRRFAAWLAR